MHSLARHSRGNPDDLITKSRFSRGDHAANHAASVLGVAYLEQRFILRDISLFELQADLLGGREDFGHRPIGVFRAVALREIASRQARAFGGRVADTLDEVVVLRPFEG